MYRVRRALILAFLTASRAIGLFELARSLTKDRLRILCYHGFALDDEHRFRSKLFMTRETFEERMRHLADKKVPVIPLDDALVKLDNASLPPGATVITVDDGFYSVYNVAQPILAKHGFPATLYVTSYYFAKQVPIFRILVSYILWKAADGTRIDPHRLGVPNLEGQSEIVLSGSNKDDLYETVREYGETQCDEPMRQQIARVLAELVGVDYQGIAKSRILSLIDKREAELLEKSGVDLELHTHRHVFPLDPQEAKRELQDNAAFLQPLVKRPLRHFCYPSGEWSPEHWPVLEQMGIVSAMTCNTGLTTRSTSRFALPRVLDDMTVSQVEFEAEVAGFLDLIRDARAYVARR